MLAIDTNLKRWKPLEALFASIGSEVESLLECIDEEEEEGRPKPFDVESLLINIVPNLLSLKGALVSSQGGRVIDYFPEHPFLQGRAFVFASKFAKFLQTELAGQYINATLMVLESPDAGAPVKISAVRALRKQVLQF